MHAVNERGKLTGGQVDEGRLSREIDGDVLFFLWKFLVVLHKVHGVASLQATALVKQG